MIRDADIFAVASELAEGADDDEARLRSAISRAYYAVYHRLLSVAQHRGYRYDRSRDLGSHASLLAFFNQPSNADLRNAVRTLRAMKIWRTEADYHLSATVTTRHAVKAIAEARRILATIPSPHPA